MDEAQFYKMIFPLLPQGRDVVVGPGDDCAAVDIGLDDNLLLLAADQLIAGVHFDPSTTAAELAGAKLLKRNLSDIAAMGGRPLNAIVTVASGGRDAEWLRSFHEGLGREAEKWAVSVCGGDTASTGEGSSMFVSSLFITGLVRKDRICLRSGMRAGDLIYATGSFGRSYGSEHHLRFTPRLKEGGFLAGSLTRAMIDVSDGLLLDLTRMAEASSVGARLFLDAVPRRDEASIDEALSDGEDYELLFSVSKDRRGELEAGWPFPETPITLIGEVVESPPGVVVDENGVDLAIRHPKKGFDHLRGS